MPRQPVRFSLVIECSIRAPNWEPLVFCERPQDKSRTGGRIMFKGLFLGLAVLTLAACGPVASAPLSPLPTSTPSGAQIMPPSSEPAITLVRSGGLAGEMMQWEIYPDGRIVASTGKETTVPAAEVARVVSEIEKLGFFELADPGGKAGKCADCFVYEITVQSGGKDRTSTFVPQATGTPTQLLQIMGSINSLLEKLPKG
jgi:hypothetical protein